MFKKGVSANPNGRPKIGVAFTETVRSFLSVKTPDENGELKTRQEQLLNKAFTESMKGGKTGAAYTQLLLDRAWGRPAQPLSNDDTGELTLRILRDSV